MTEAIDIANNLLHQLRDEIRSGFAAVDKRLDHVEKRLDNVERNIGILADGLISLRRDVQTLTRDVQTLTMASAGHGERLAAIEHHLALDTPPRLD